MNVWATLDNLDFSDTHFVLWHVRVSIADIIIVAGDWVSENWVFALDWWSESGINSNEGSIMRMWVDVVVVTGELIGGLVSSCAASGDGWP